VKLAFLHDIFIELSVAFNDLYLVKQTVTGMEDIAESRRILEAHDWDLLAAITSHLGLESQQFSIAHLSRSSSSPTPSPSPLSNNSPRMNLPPLRNPAPPVPNPRETRLGLFGFVYQVITKPFQWFFQYVWDFIGFGLRFIQADPRRGMKIFNDRIFCSIRCRFY